MGLQSIIEKSEFTNFLQCGAILQLSPDQFKLIWGPFHFEPLNLKETTDEKTVIYNPQFWDFDSEEQKKTGRVGIKEKLLSRQQLLRHLNLELKINAKIKWNKISDQDFQIQFNWSQQKFKSGELLKTVPIILQTGEGDYTTSHLAATLTKLVQGEHFGSAYGLWQENKGFFGQSPEIILDWRSSNCVLETMALAGTTAKESNNKEQILNDAKILNEHQIVVKDICSVLASVNDNKKINIQKLQILPLKYLNHLLTPISIEGIEFNDLESYIEKIHPSAALGLFPRKKIMYQQMKKFEIQKKRQNFAAPFGFFNRTQARVIAAIRCFYFSEKQIILYAGCGVTAESIFQSELIELENKINSVKKMMGLGE